MMNLCKAYSTTAHKVVPTPHPVTDPEIAGCDCGCHQVIVLEEYDKEAWWLPAQEPTMGMSLKIRKKPRPGLILAYYYREPRPLGLLGPWVETMDDIEIDPVQLQSLKKITAPGWHL